MEESIKDQQMQYMLEYGPSDHSKKSNKQEESESSDESQRSLPDSEEFNERGQWSRKVDYILSQVGFCVGLGNLWRFPYMANRNGGGAFLIPFLFFLIICGMPMFFMEVSIGQFSGKGASKVWDICPLFRGLGIGMTMISWMLTLYYNIIIAWCIYYIIRSCATTLPWSTCSNWWNTPLCTDDVIKLQINGSAVSNLTADTNITTTSSVLRTIAAVPYTIGGENVSDVSMKVFGNDSVSHTSVEEFWQYNALRISSGLDHLGGLQWHLALCLLGAWLIVFFCLVRGVRSVGKVVYVTATLPYVLLVVLLIRGLTLPGAVDGILYFIKPDFSKLLEIQVWLEACLQVFYSLGPGWGGLITMSSYSKFNNNCFRDSILVACISEGTSIFAGFVIFTVLGVMAHHQGVHVSTVVSSGPGLGFVVYPEALSQLPIPQLWSFIFFVMLLTVGLDSQFVMLEVVLTSLIDTFPKLLLSRRTLLTGAMCVVCFFIGLPICCNGGIYIFQLLDWYVAALILILGILECILVSWIYGFHRLDKDVELMLGRPVPRIFKLLLGIVIPIVLFVSIAYAVWAIFRSNQWSTTGSSKDVIAIVLTLLEYQTPKYGTYEYPWYSAVIGWTWALLPIIPIPLVMFKELYSAKGSIKNRLWHTLTPSSNWVPNSAAYRPLYKGHNDKPSLKKSFYSIFH